VDRNEHKDRSPGEELARPAAQSQLEVELTGLFRIRQLALELQARFGKGVDTVFLAQLGDLSLGAIIEYLVGLAVPGFRLELSPPWDVINSINLRNLTFEVNVTQSKIGFSYGNLGLDLTFLKLEKVQVFFSLKGKRSVDIAVFGSVLGKDFSKDPITWDLLNQPPPSVPTRGAKIFDLSYLGLGQRVTLRDIESLTTVGAVIEALKASYRDVPPDGNPLADLPALKFDAGSGWLIGTQVSVLDTVALSAVFNDPKLYGLLVSLSGARAKALAGLQFEILYRKVADDVGLYHIELKLPDALRQIEAGAASITLPIIDVDIYTNGNFLIDLGFPRNLDFSRSFVIQVLIGPIPVIGAGGLYFGVLDGKTSKAVPRITNGEFVPVIVFGVGARLGVGKTFNKGILKAGAYLAVQGLLEGALGFFQPTSPSVAKATFYRISGAIGIVAHIYGTVEFAIIKATLDLYAYATVQGVFEAYLPTVLSFEAGVRVSLEVRVNLGLFTVSVDLSFSATFRTSMEIGSRQETPWVLAAGEGDSANLALYSQALEGRGFRPLEGGVLLLDPVYARVLESGVSWRGVRVADERPTLGLTFQPMTSIGFVDDHPGGGEDGACPGFGPDAEQQVQLVAALFIQGPEGSGDGAGDGMAPVPVQPVPSDFELLSRYGLLWAIQRVKEAKRRVTEVDAGDAVTLSELRLAYHSLTAPGALDVCDVVDFLRLNFTFQIEPPPTKGDDGPTVEEMAQRSYVVFPMLPFLVLNAGSGDYTVDFFTRTPCSASYRRELAEYFEQLAAQNTPGRQGLDPAAQGSSVDTATDPPMAACILLDYVSIILRQVLEKAIDLYELFPYTAQEGDTLGGIARRFGLVDAGAVARIVRANETETAFLVKDTELTLAMGAQRVLGGDTLRSLAERTGLQVVDVGSALRTQAGVLSESASLRVAGGSYTLEKGDTLESIARTFFTTAEAIRAANPGFPWQPVPPGQSVPVAKEIRLPATEVPVGGAEALTLGQIADLFRVSVAALASLNAERSILREGALAFLPVTAVVQQGDSLETLAGRFGLQPVGLLAAAVDTPGLFAPGATIDVQHGTYVLREEDTVAEIAARFSITEVALYGANPGFDWTPPPGLSVPWGETVRLPPVTVPLSQNSSLGTLARFVGLAVDELVAQIASDKILLASARVPLPPLPYTVGDSDTLASVSRRFGVTTLALAQANPGPEARFGTVLVPEAETLPEATLLELLQERGDFAASTGTVSRFLLHGLRLPSPEEIPGVVQPAGESAAAGQAGVDWADLCLYPVYTLTGQQWGAPAKPSTAYGIELSLSGASTNGDADGPDGPHDSDGASWPCPPPEITFQSETPDKGLTIHLSTLDLSTIEGFAKLLNTDKPPFDPQVLAFTRLPPYSTVGKQFGLGKPVPWQAPSVPQFTSEPLGQAAGQPSLYALPEGLGTVISDLGDRPAPLVVQVGSQRLAEGPCVRAEEAEGYGWATRFEIRLRRVPAPGGAKTFVPSLYQVYSADSRSRTALLTLLDALRGEQSTDDVTLHLLYSANPAGGRAADGGGSDGLRSDPVDPASVLLLKANLSTLTRSPATGLDLLEAPRTADEALFSASLAESRDFLTLLWEASVVNSGGYYLFYRIGDGGELPPQLFNQNPEATLTVVAVVRPAGRPETIGLRPFHNALVFTENLGSADAVVFAEASRFPVAEGAEWSKIAAQLHLTPEELAWANASVPRLVRPGAVLELPETSYTVLPGDDLLTISLETGASLADVADALGDRTDVLLAGAELFRGPQWVARQASLRMGNEGFRLVRTDPDPEATAGRGVEAQADPATALQVRFNLFGFRLADFGAFVRTAEGLPAGPGHSTGDPCGGSAAGELLGLPAIADGTPPWLYQRALEVARHGKWPTPVTPVPGPDPYTGLDEEVRMDLQIQDLFGNRGLADGVLPALTNRILYRDPVIGLNQWPASQATYRFVASDTLRDPVVPAQAGLEVSFTLDPSRYVPPAASPWSPIAQRAATDRDLYRLIYFQVAQPDVTLSAGTTVDGESPHRLDKGALVNLAVAAYRYLDTVADLVQSTAAVAAGDTLAALAGEFHVSVQDLAELNRDAEELLAVGAEIQVPLVYAVVRNDSLETILQRSDSSLSPAELGTLNRGEPLQAGTVLALPDGGHHTIVEGDTLETIAAAQDPPVLPGALAEQNRALPNLFPDGEEISLGVAVETVAAGDTLASLARAHGLGVGLLAAANGGRPILHSGTEIALPSHLELGDETLATHRVVPGDTFASIARSNGSRPTLLGLANQVLDGVLEVGATLSYQLGDRSHRETVAEHDTLATVLARFREAFGEPGISAGDLAAANADAEVLHPGSLVLLAPPVMEEAASVSVESFPSVLFPVAVEVALARDPELVDPAFAGVPEVLEARATLAPRLVAVGRSKDGDQDLGLERFAKDFQAAFDGQLRLATGAEPEQGSADGATAARRLVAVQWQTAKLAYQVVDRPSFFAPRPLLNTPWAGEAPIRPYSQGKPLGKAVGQSFQGIDLDTWGRRFLAAMDRALSPGASVTGFRLAPTAWTDLATAKGRLVSAIGATVRPILEGDPAGDVDAARTALEQRLSIELSEAYRVDTVVQLPVDVTSPADDPKTALRLSGKPRGAAYTLPQGATLHGVAEHFEAPVDLLATVMAGIRYVLAPGFVARFDGREHTVRPDDSLGVVAAALDTTPQALAALLATTQGFLQEGAGLNLVRRREELTAIDSLATAIARLALDVTSEGALEREAANFAAMNASVSNIFRAGKKIEVEGRSHVTRTGDTLETIAEALGGGVTPRDVVEALLDVEDLVEPGTLVSLLVRVPGYTLSDAKVPLFDTERAGESSTLTFLFHTASNTALSRLQLDLGYQVNELEYDIGDVSWADGYQTSSWLSFILTASDDSLGPVDIPIPLRAYPVPPVVDGQSFEQELPEEPTLDEIKTWSYRYQFTYDPAAQDQLFTSQERNVPQGAGRPLRDAEPELPELLAQYAAIATPLEADLALLATPGATRDPALAAIAANALEIFSTLAGDIAHAWALWQPPTAIPPTARPVYRVLHRPATDGRDRVRLQAANGPAGEVRSEAFPAIRLLDRELEERIQGRGFSVATFAPRPARAETASPVDRYEVRVPDLQIIDTQNIWGSVAVQRNGDLIPGRTTSSEFVYQLDDVRFTSKLVPLLRYPKAFDVATLPPAVVEPEKPTLLDYLIRLFTVVLSGEGGGSPQARNLRLSVDFGFTLAGSSAASSLVSRVPVVLRPTFLFVPSRDLDKEGGFCFDLATSLECWLLKHRAELAAEGRWIFDLSLYTTLGQTEAATQPPLLELGELYLDLADVAPSNPNDD